MESYVYSNEIIKNSLKAMNLPKNVRIFDTTLRDGEQTPGVSLTPDEKIAIAEKLSEIGVSAIEAGFPVSSEGERESIKKIASLGLDCEICGLSRAVKKDIDVAIDCDVQSIHTFIATSPLHREYKLKMSKEQIIETLVKSIEYIKEHGITVEFSAEDATRTELEYLKEAYKNAVDAGADRINVPDTVGVMVPNSMKYLISELKKDIKVPISVHCHNDFGLGVSNSIAAVEAGALQVHCTVNGLGERAGNASLEETVMSLDMIYGIDTGIKTEMLTKLSKLVSHYTGIKTQPNKAIVGENSFAHESGIHAHGVLAHALTYEPIDPEIVGNRRRIVLGKHSGAHAIKSKLSEIGVEVGTSVSNEQFSEIVERIKSIGDKGKIVTDADVMAIAEDITKRTLKSQRIVDLEQFAVITGNNVIPTASVALKIKDQVYKKSEIGVGPVDAALKAIQAVVGEHIRLNEYSINAISGGTDAIAEVTVRLENHEKEVIAKATSDDVVRASVEAVIDGINKLME
ncbi:isopropylmalate/citramalate/homocitrate synthase [Methanococcus vannielii SB]|jgi:2-isopropylmalate synthase|uniref:2-isopropylmalate synthase n=1 Tax=Methanococcus vannielii (strain ATCC 35089 / DSM 1224 / JCM 13029 / OCM 148 / SB) TaxID=406327 RepID=A6UP71_METVS|nr:2-isopropylmalate synthase [Methanococcus vannielii]ABR54293.1 isopropylmalate/citramalate/homocitrate synthase [Methanococcus vannielii SB]